MEKSDDPFVRLPTPFHEALCRTRIAGEPRMILDAIIRKTIGWQKKEDWISLSQFMEMTGLQKNAICRAIAHLERMKIIHKKENGKKSFYSVELKTACWIPLPKKSTVPQKEKHHSHKGESSFSKKGHTRDTDSKETSSKENVLAVASTSVPEPEFIHPLEIEYRTFLKGMPLILGREKMFTKKGFKKYEARRKKFDLERLCRAFENLLSEPGHWKITHNAHRPMEWWLKSDEYLEELENCHLKGKNPAPVQVGSLHSTHAAI